MDAPGKVTERGFLTGSKIGLTESLPDQIPKNKKEHTRRHVLSSFHYYIFRLNNFYVNGVLTFFTLFNFELNFVILANFIDQTGYVNEDIFV